MTIQEVKDLLATTRSEDEWNKICDFIKSQGGYPDWWFVEIIMSGFAKTIMWGWDKR